MKKTLIIFIILLCFECGNAQTPNLTWAFGIGGVNYDQPFSLLTDTAGNVYTLGRFSDTTDFDPSPTGTFNLVSITGYDNFIQKVDNNGNLLWAKNIIGAEYSSAVSMALDKFSNIYSIGGFSDTVDFDPDNSNFNLIGPGAFIQKLGSSGDFISAKALDNIGVGFIKVDAANNIYIAGSFSGTKDFDPGALVFNLTADGVSDIFILKLDSSYNFQWAKQIGFSGSFSEEGNSIAIDSDGDILLAGTLDGNFEGNFLLIQKYSSGGILYWTKQIGLGSVHNYFDANSVITDDVGNVYTTGNFGTPGGYSVDFDPGIGTFYLIAHGQVDIFVLKLSGEGDFVWVKQMSGVGAEVGKSICADGMANIYITGFFEGTVDFNPDSSIHNLTSIGESDAFIEKLDSAGNFVWSVKIGSTNPNSFDLGYSVATDGYGSVFTAGMFNNTADMDPGAGVYHLNSNGGSDIFIQKLGIVTGFSEFRGESNLFIYPNPAISTFTIHSTAQLQNFQIEIYNLLGEKMPSQIISSDMQSHQIIVDASKLSTGVYFVLVSGEEKQNVFKLVVN